MRAQSRILTAGFMVGLSFMLSTSAFASDYTVVKGDCLWRIAQRKLDSGPRWVEIYQANRSQIKDPDLIYPNQVFTIPDGQPNADPVGAAPDTETPEAPPEAASAEATSADAPDAAETPETAETPEAAETPEPAGPADAEPAEAETPEAKPMAARSNTSVQGLVGTPTDYSDPDNWANLPEASKQADTLYIYPTVYCNTDAGAPEIVPVDDETMREGARENIERNCGVFSESTNVFVPYYRQSNLAAVADLRGDALMEFQMQEQRTDVYAALDYYFEELNGGRPYILAGHAQGSLMLKLVLREYMQAHPEYYERMIAAYVLGYSITNEDMQANPNLKFAEGATDTGVIVSWNVEGPENSDNMCVLPGSIAINPINWKRDGTYAYSMYNKGSRAVNPDTNTVDDSVPGVADAEVDLERGVVVCSIDNLSYDKVDNSGIPNLYGERSFHSNDYGFYYYNLKENVGARTNAWFSQSRA